MIRFLFITLLITQLTWAQKPSTVSGIVVDNGLLLKKVEVVNLSNKSNTTTNSKGFFSIEAQPNDTLVFHLTKYEAQKFIVEELDLAPNVVEIILDQKATELDEVVVHKNQNKSSRKEIQAIIDKQYVDDLQSSPKNRLVYNGSIENGVDLSRIGKEIFNLFKSTKKQPQISFRSFVFKHCDKYFFRDQLKLEEDQVLDFIAFCETDPNINAVIAKDNVFDLMDFLTSKKQAFTE
ncbi:carboxypeptidase-like regulatory domain-containing protein [Flavobacterium agricola]|uniref:Carboxypeptidase-like regulatory domain-containing protein n=1 Tax=Flavobacterium agricola TaxID=2870839 RepID=A0ABY6M3L4_9FLAO|nr:carboxypeptidase-like regulatory domain-containing protein [Flavobacterium agricola]UYW02502.1 carboxypeptidase-like regulatory domain-containing protein [Flavobacterium agricola]